IHHPNEIAQNQAHEGCADTGARIWMHNNFLVERSGKMSKSSGEFLRLQLLIDKGFHPLAYRLMCLQAHYRSELEFSWEGLQAAFVRLKRMVRILDEIRAQESNNITRLLAGNLDPFSGLPKPADVTFPELQGLSEQFEVAISNDLNTAETLVILERVLQTKRVDAAQKMAIARPILDVLGLGPFDEDGWKVDPKMLRIRPKAATITEAEIETALAARKEARAQKDFATSDRIRDDLIAKGVEVMDGDLLGWDWKLDV
ncbi:MAG: cysteine--tRNA ligase, partial [Sphingorhabdus sp.]